MTDGENLGITSSNGSEQHNLMIWTASTGGEIAAGMERVLFVSEFFDAGKAPKKGSLIICR
ncbi:hypothetical protein [Martelella limonii]|uniref:hypothetical protein n=1 Tax=Martelella limonii TaxID=1647649 RepID=UPI0015802CDF|nr:hypothetical protein [Martelella limonii]